MLHTGTISLIRKTSVHTAGFAMFRKGIEELYRYSPELHTDERAYLETLRFTRRKSSYLLGRLSAKHALEQILPERVLMNSFTIGSGVFNFPIIEYLPYSGYQVTISHCDSIGMALAYPESHPLGIDIEKIDHKKNTVFVSMFTDEEIQLTKTCFLNVDITNTLLWTAKESLSKVLKTGLMIDFKILEVVSLSSENGIHTSIFRHFPQYKCLSIVLDTYIISITCPKNTACNLDDFIKMTANLEQVNF